MEKINIAELLKDCPQGMELDCTMFEGVFLERVDNDVKYPIAIRTGKNDIKHLTKEGCWNTCSNAKCIIFPKGKTTWEGFVPPCKFKVGDRVRPKNTPSFIVTINDIAEDSYWYGYNNAFWIKDQDDWELVPNKFDINTLKAFDQILVRLDNDNQWYATWFSHIDERQESFCRRYVTAFGKSYAQIIPYKGNEHLCGTKQECDEYFKTWE